MSEQPWPVVLDVPVHHVPQGARAPRDALVALRTAFVPRRIGASDMEPVGVTTRRATYNPYRSFEGSLWIRAALTGCEGFPSDEDPLRRFLGCRNRHEPGAGYRGSLLAGTPLMPLLQAREILQGPRREVSELPTRGILWDGSERVAAAAAAQLRDDLLFCEGRLYVRNPGPLVVPVGKRRQAVTFNPASVDGLPFLLPLFVGPGAAERQWAELLPFAAMLPAQRPEERAPTSSEPLMRLAPCHPERIPGHLHATDHDLRATALHGPAWVLRELARHAGGVGGAAVREAMRPLAEIDRTLRFGIADDAEVERALRLCRTAIEAARTAVGPAVVGRLAFTFAQVLHETVLPRLERAVPEEDAGALASLGPGA